MIALWKWNLSQFRRRIWVPIAAYAALGVATSIATWALKPLVPPDLPAKIGADAVATILEILASSMLAVTTFSLSIMTSAFGATASGATPRAITLLKDDRVTQRVLATFVGAFLFSLSGLIGLQTGIYEDRGRFILFLVTLAVLAAVVFQLVRWIGHLADYGRLTDTIARVETATREALAQRMAHPYLGGHPLSDSLAQDLAQRPAIRPRDTGYVQMIDMESLHALMESHKTDLAVTVLPGAFVHPGMAVAHLLGPGDLPEDLAPEILRRFVIAPTRSFDQDPRFGVLTLTEIAARALSPAVNDPGTAIDILGRQMRILTDWREREDATAQWSRLFVAPLRLSDLMTDAFASIGRDGAAMVEVQIRLHKMLAGLAALSPGLFRDAALRQSDRALALAEVALTLEEDRAVLRELNRALHDLPAGTVAQARPRRA
ncbi:DUF2254 domain-containing protein [Gemmobacter caeruleus]|uniref:DUF2254 domain-containing protein n=1 Tax=Gemmobacter caeruleus TaxID=2595004 RepID=UPI0011EBDB13|nr:DUF2254 domain-containing protein [Gemmobacter caeruleus]